MSFFCYKLFKAPSFSNRLTAILNSDPKMFTSEQTLLSPLTIQLVQPSRPGSSAVCVERLGSQKTELSASNLCSSETKRASNNNSTHKPRFTEGSMYSLLPPPVGRRCRLPPPPLLTPPPSSSSSSSSSSSWLKPGKTHRGTTAGGGGGAEFVTALRKQPSLPFARTREKASQRDINTRISRLHCWYILLTCFPANVNKLLSKRWTSRSQQHACNIKTH